MDALIGQSETLQHAKEVTQRARNLRILFLGETGTGKTPFARYSHFNLNNLVGRERAFEQVNCAALDADHFQDVMFGHKRGAFTGAISDKTGLVELAKGGDLFLDEIGDMPLSTQAHLLTFLDNQEYYRLGDDQKRRADVRVLAATNRDLPLMIKEGTFRLDLYSRLSQVIVRIPPLRERICDLPLLFEYFLRTFSKGQTTYDPKVLDFLYQQQWREGNVREFKDTIEFLCVMAENSGRIDCSHLPDHFWKSNHEPITHSLQTDISLPLLYEVGLEEYVTRVEDRLLDSVLKERRGRLGRLARDLKISRSTLYRKLRRIGFPRCENS